MKPLIPRLPAPGSVTAKTIAMLPFLPEVMNCLTPLRTYPLPAGAALVRRLAASEPACGSLRQNAPSNSPRAMGLRKRSFCSSVQNLRIGMQATELCTLMMVEQAPSPAAISSMASA